jgi:Animal haem peroxidase
MRKIVLLLAALLVLTPVAGADIADEIRTLDGSGNNRSHPEWGKTNTQYLRVARTNYSDGIAKPVGGPSTRYVSNRIFNDAHQNLFSENGVTQWGFVWGQFMDHTFGLRQEAGGETANIPFSTADSLESFTNTVGSIPFMRTPAAPGTGGGKMAREQINTVSSYIDGASVYGPDTTRLEWLREGPVDGRLSNNGAKLLLDNGFLPRGGDPRRVGATTPEMALMGRLEAPGGAAKAFVAGDKRANENIALSSTHTLFALEHNRIVSKLPSNLPDELKFQIARRVIGAEQQYITYKEFLPSLGVSLPAYQGYKDNVNASLGNEFATVGYRAHSMIHGELEAIGEAADYTAAQLAAIEAQGVEVEADGDEVEFVIPLNLAFGNPDLLRLVGTGAVLHGLGGEPQYKNDEMIDNQLRSVLFQVPAPGNEGCLDGPTLPACFKGVVDLGAVDIERGRDHGMPLYNDMRKAFGLKDQKSFTAITGESTDRFPTNDPLITGNPINDPNILDFTALFDAAGNPIPLGSEATQAEAVVGVRRTTLAARLKAIYGDPNKLDAFVGMLSERHVHGSEFGELQLAMWKQQFQALRDGDRFFYQNDAVLPELRRLFGIDYRRTLAQIIEENTGIDVQDDVFEAVG